MMLRTTLIATLIALPAAAQTTQEGMVANPCAGVPTVIPASIIDYVKAKQASDQDHPAAAPAAIPPEAMAYSKATQEAAKTDWGNLCKYDADNKRLLAGPASGRRIVFMGDSITQGWEVAQPALFTGGIVDRGISGQTTPQMLLRFAGDVIALKPQIVHIMAGTNDVAGNTGPNSAAQYRNNILAMVTLAKAHGIKVILAAIPPAATFTWKPALKPAALIAELNAWLKGVAKAQGLVFVDYHAALAEPDGSLRRTLTYDGVHPNLAGYKVMEPLTRKALKEAGAK